MFRERTFRISLLPFAAFSMALVAFLLVVERVVIFAHRSLSPFGSFEWGLVGAMGAAAVVLWAALPQRLGPDGIRGTDGIGRYHDVRWEEIERVSSIFGFLWVRHGKPGKALMMPKFMADGFGFREYVRRHAPEGNPLRTYLTAR